MSHDLPPGRGTRPTLRTDRGMIAATLAAAAAMLGPDAPNSSAPVRFVRRRAKHLIELDANRDIIRIVPPHGPEEDAARELRAVEKRRRKNRGRLAAVKRGGYEPK